MATNPKQAATEIMQILRFKGYDAFLVGGCVRDLLLGREPKDYDITTNARPEQVQAMFPKTIPVGASFGVIVVVHDDIQIEVATYRADGTYTDGRRPDQVEYSTSPVEDVVRRDFTINGLLMAVPSNPHQIQDFVNGMEDIESRTIRAIGDPNLRFGEDALRMLRAVRFASQLGFDIAPETFNSIKMKAHTITRVSKERIREELFKLLTGRDVVRGLTLLVTSGLAEYVLEDKLMHGPFAFTLQRFQANPTPNALKAVAMLLCDYDGVEQIIDNLMLPNADAAELTYALRVPPLLDLMMCSPYDADRATKVRMARQRGFNLGLELADQNARLHNMSAEFHELLVEFYHLVTHEDLNPKPLATGDDLIALGMTPGPEFKRLLYKLETLQLNNEITTREQALEFVSTRGVNA